MHAAQALKAEVTIDGTHLIRIKVHDNALLDVDDVLAINAERKRLAENRPHTVLVISGQFSSITKEAMQLVASEDFHHYKLAEAFVVTSLAQRLIGNFFIKMYKPKTLTRVFNSQDDALQWLKGFY